MLPPGAKRYIGEMLPPGAKRYIEEMLPPGAKGYMGGICAARGIIARYM